MADACLALREALGLISSIMEKPSTVVPVLGRQRQEDQKYKPLLAS